MYVPYTLVKNFTDENLQYELHLKDGKKEVGEIAPNSMVEFVDAKVGDILHLHNDEYHGKEVINYAMNPKYYITYKEDKIQNMKDNRGYHPIVIIKKPQQQIKVKLEPEILPVKKSETINWKLFFMFVLLLIVLIASLIGVIYVTTSKKYGGSASPILDTINESIMI